MNGKPDIVMKKPFLWCMLVLLVSPGAFGEEGAMLLGDLAAQKDAYEGKKITMPLKLKSIDNLFGKIYFYDRKNQDIVFDVAIQSGMEEYRTEMLNLREGLEYHVTFLFNGVGNIGIINGELIGFTPAILMKLPEGGEKTEKEQIK